MKRHFFWAGYFHSFTCCINAYIYLFLSVFTFFLPYHSFHSLYRILLLGVQDKNNPYIFACGKAAAITANASEALLPVVSTSSTIIMLSALPASFVRIALIRNFPLMFSARSLAESFSALRKRDALQQCLHTRHYPTFLTSILQAGGLGRNHGCEVLVSFWGH